MEFPWQKVSRGYYMLEFRDVSGWLTVDLELRFNPVFVYNMLSIDADYMTSDGLRNSCSIFQSIDFALKAPLPDEDEMDERALEAAQTVFLNWWDWYHSAIPLKVSYELKALS